MNPAEVEQAMWESERVKLQEETDRVLHDLATVDEQSLAAQAEYHKASLKADRKSATPEQIKEADRLHRAVLNLQGRGNGLAAKLHVLRSEGELERRTQTKLATKERIRNMTSTAKKPAKVTAKSQGVPDVYLNEEGNFLVGIDARCKSDCINAILGLPSPNALTTLSPQLAQKIVEARGWTGQLARKREIVETKAKATAEKAEAKATAAKAKVEAKKSAPAKAAKTATAGGDLSGEAKPNAKPAPKAKSSRPVGGNRKAA